MSEVLFGEILVVHEQGDILHYHLLNENGVPNYDLPLTKEQVERLGFTPPGPLLLLETLRTSELQNAETGNTL